MAELNTDHRPASLRKGDVEAEVLRTIPPSATKTHTGSQTHCFANPFIFNESTINAITVSIDMTILNQFLRRVAIHHRPLLTSNISHPKLRNPTTAERMISQRTTYEPLCTKNS